MEEGQGGSGISKQTQAERRQIRFQYRELFESTRSNQQELCQAVKAGEDDPLKAILKSADETFKKVETPREGVLDAAVICQVSEVMKLRVQKLCTNLVVFNPKEFAKKIANFVKDSPGEDSPHMDGEAWTRLGAGVQSFFKRSPPLHLMYGSFDPGPPVVKERKVRQRIKDDEPKKAVVPQQLKDFTETKKTENTTQEVTKMLRTLKNLYKKQDSQPLCYFEFVINPESYSNTIENMFYAAFLIKDGYARMFLDDDELPVIEPVERREGDPDQAAEKRQQVIMAMSYKKYKEIIKTFSITGAPLIETRKGLDADEDDDAEAPPLKKK